MMNLLIPAIQHPADQMLFVKNVTAPVLALACPNISAILIWVADPNAFQTMSVLAIKHVSIINASIHVLEFVQLMPFAKHSITIQLVLALRDSREIR